MTKFYNFFSLKHGEEDKDKVREDVLSNVSFRGANLWVLTCAIFIASIGLNVNSTAVIIGAMLISPLMGPIVGSGFALATYDFDLLKRSVKNLFIATLVGFLVSSIYFYLSPFKDVQSELLARTSPTIYDVMIAFIGGIVGAVSITRVEKGNPIPGVAIATALMPPLCTAGFGLATLNFQFLAGALYLYTINCFFIGISTFIVIKYLKYEPVKTENLAHDKKVRLSIWVLMILMVLPSCYLAYSLLQEKRFMQNAEKFIQKEFTDKGNIIVYKKINNKSQPKTIEVALMSKELDSAQIEALNNELSNYNLNNTKLQIKQNNSDLKKEILSELNRNEYMLSEKDYQIQQLHEALAAYQLGSQQLDKEVKILFPEIDDIYFAKATNYALPDTLSQQNIIIYKSADLIDENKLLKWLQSKFGSDSILLIKK